MDVPAGTLERPVISSPLRPVHRRRGRLIFPIALVLFAVIGGLTFRQRVLLYDPLQLGGLEFDGSNAPGNVAVHLHDYDAVLVPAVAGKEFQVRWNIWNGGDRTVRVTDVPFEVTTPYLVRTRLEIGDGSSDERRGGSARSLIQFQPFDLKPGQARELAFTYRFRDCPFPPVDVPYERMVGGRTEISAGMTTSWTGQRIVYDVFGISRSTVLKTHSELVLVNATGDCPK